MAPAILAGCHRESEWYPVPEQRQPVSVAEPAPASLMVNMNDADATEHFVKDIGSGLEGAAWRWTGKRPTVRLLLAKTTGLKFVAEFTIPGVTFRETGPVSISFFIDDQIVGDVRYDTPGGKKFEVPVTPEWLQTATETTLAAEIDKLYVSPTDGTPLGLILTKIGFERQ